MTKYYRVKKETPTLNAGAIIANTKTNGNYGPIEDIWNRVPKEASWSILAAFIESPVNSEWYERVYKDTVSGNIFRTADQMKKLYEESFKS